MILKKIFLLSFLFTLVFAPGRLLAQDSDLDGMPDAHELLFACLNPTVNDAAGDPDTDALTSLQEYSYSPELNPCVADTDGDAILDGAETATGSNPLDPRVAPGVKAEDTLMSPSIGLFACPRLAWTGSELGQAWVEYSSPTVPARVTFNRISTAGNPLILNTWQSNAYYPYDYEMSLLPDLVWTGSEFSLFKQEYMPNLTRITAQGAQFQGPTDLNVSRRLSHTLWAGSRFAVPFSESYGSWSLAFFDPAGAMIGTPAAVIGPTASSPALAWTGSEIGLSWTDHRDQGRHEIYFARLALDGTRIGEWRITSDDSFSDFSALAWTGSEFGLAWLDQEYGLNRIMFLRLAPDGSPIGSTARVGSEESDPLWPVVAWSGTEFGVAWMDYRSGGTSELYFTRVSPAGLNLAREFRVASAPGRAISPSLIWAGSEYWMAWSERALSYEASSSSTIHLTRLAPDDPDGDGLLDSEEALQLTSPSDWDSDNDGAPDGWEAAANCLDPLVNDSSADPDGDSLDSLGEYAKGSDPCDLDEDNDGSPDLSDCDPWDPNVWTACATCVDNDEDGFYLLCDAYNFPVLGPDCNDNDTNNWSRCATCTDADGDGYYHMCDRYFTITMDYIDADPTQIYDDHCNDEDDDGWYMDWAGGYYCAAFSGINMLDCDDANQNAWNTCATCVDSDNDRWVDGACNSYVGINTEVCSSLWVNYDPWSYPVGYETVHICDNIDGSAAADCDVAARNHWTDCGACTDNDLDGRGAGCNLGPDCNDANPSTWDSCDSCVDVDGDGRRGHCNTGSDDCNDLDPNNWDRCSFCADQDQDGVFSSCDRYLTLPGPDCNDSNLNVWNTCDSCHDLDLDGFYGLCNAYNWISGPDCDDTEPFAWNTCDTCVDLDADGWRGTCDRTTVSNPEATIGSGVSSGDQLFAANYKISRLQTIYLASQINRAGRITSIAFNLTQLPGQPLMNFTIRMKHTSRTEQYAKSWDGPDSGWTTVYQANQDSFNLGWKIFSLSTPFNYNGSSNLMVDISFQNTSTSTAGLVKYSSIPSYRSIFFRSLSDYGDPLSWSGSSDPTPLSWMGAPNVKFGFQASVNTPDCNDGSIVVHPGQASPEGMANLCDGMDNQCPGELGYGLIDEGCADSDSDGLSDQQEILLGSNQFSWDSDGDRLPDKFEFDHLSGHGAFNTNPLASGDGEADFDGDGIANADDYWNGGGSMNGGSGGAVSGGGLWVADKTGWAACGYWGEGDGDGFISPGDVAVVSLAMKGSPDYAAVYPPTGETQDLDADGFLSPSDRGLLSSMIKGQTLTVLGSRPEAVGRVTPTTGVTPSAKVGDAITITVAVTNTATAAAPGIPVVFSIAASSSGSATIVGGEGADVANTRYDLTTARADGGRASATLVLTVAGTVTVEAKVKQCGADGIGRYCAEVLLAEPVTITVTP